MEQPGTAPSPADQQAETITVRESTVILQPLVMRFPNRHGVYCPSNLRPPRTLSYREFLRHYADNPKQIRVCFEETVCRKTLLHHSRLVTAYSVGLSGWHTIVATTTIYSADASQTEDQ